MHAEELLAECDHVLLAFDGPVAELRPVPAAERLRVLIAAERLPKRVARTGDPFVVLAHATTMGPATGRAVYEHLCRIEFEQAGGARVTDGVRGALATLAAVGTRVTVISGLNADAVRSFLVMHGLDMHVRHISARSGPDAAGLPPAPDLVATAAGGDVCVFVGATRADLAAARAAGVGTLRYRRPGDGEPLEPHRNPWFAALSQPVRRLL
ncbi:HAD family hydrolase [Actinophytocola glycyrrhizae]|uniref:HAD family hydrolase n=1 Tax=Actinophytocola glycyrrhizae TaxID=2044873 RepID=A0ABV9S4N6_9PSEU